MKYHIITMKECSYCDKAKDLMDQSQVGYVEYPAEGLILKLMPMAGLKTVPQVWDENWNYIGGYTHLKDLLKETKATRIKERG